MLDMAGGMRDVFDELRDQLDAVERWLPNVDARPLTPAERRLAAALARYVRHCRRDGRKWRSAKAAERAIAKVEPGVDAATDTPAHEVITMASSQGLDSLSSELIVSELVRQLGEAPVLALLGVSASRLATLLAGRGRLSEIQAHRVVAGTRKPCPLWLLDGGRRRARTDAQRQAVADSQVIRDHYERSAAAYVERAEAALAAHPPAAAARRSPARPSPRRRTKPAA